MGSGQEDINRGFGPHSLCSSAATWGSWARHARRGLLASLPGAAANWLGISDQSESLPGPTPGPVLARLRFASVGKRCMGIRAFMALRPGVAFGWPGIKPGPGWGTGLLPRLLPAAARGILGMGDLPHDVLGM